MDINYFDEKDENSKHMRIQRAYSMKNHCSLIIRALLPVLILSALYSCDGKYEKVGKVYMNKVISLDELWEKREELKGEVVTLRLDTLEAYGLGKARPSVDFPNRGSHTWRVNTKGNYYAQDYVDLMNNLPDSIKQTPSVIDAGSRRLHFLSGRDTTIILPKWVNYKGPVLQKGEMESALGSMDRSPDKIISCILMDFWLETSLIPCDDGFTEHETHAFVFAITGTKWLKEGVLSHQNYYDEKCPDGTDI